MAAVKTIRKRLVIFSALFIVNTLLASWFLIMTIFEGAAAASAVSIILLFPLFRQWERFQSARLICDNRILTVPSAVLINGQDGCQTKAEETIVSTFGILVGGEVYKWGCNGIRGVRLTAINIGHTNITLNFGNREQTLKVKLPHGLTDAQAVVEIAHRLWRETGVEAEIVDW
jgi:hypothetical protein